MNSPQPPEHENVELLLKQMKVRGPSSRLDDSISNLAAASGKNFCAPDVASGERPVSFGWATLAATAIVAGIGGMLIGNAYSNSASDNARDSGVVLAKKESKSGDIQSQITPVKFNTQAYELLHGHSANDDYADCGKCHVADQDEAFEGWFYGDHEFFKKHHNGKLSNCSACHGRIDNGKDKQQPEQPQQGNENFRHADFPNVKCASCHGLVDGPLQQRPRRKPILDQNDLNKGFNHHFEGVENCSNCHTKADKGEDKKVKPLPLHQGWKSMDCKECHVT